MERAGINLAASGVNAAVFRLCIVWIHAAESTQHQTSFFIDAANHTAQGIHVRFQQNRCIRRIVRLVRTVIDTYKNAAFVGQLCIVAQLFICSEDILRRVCGKAGRTVNGKNFFGLF